MAPLQSISRLRACGARVDLAAISDPVDYRCYLEDVEQPFRWLLADTACHPGVLDLAPEQTILFHLRSPHAESLVWREHRLPIIDEPMITVVETCLVLAAQFGADQVILAGLDLSTPEA